MSRTSTRPLANLVLQGNLEPLLLGWREQGESYERIARHLGERGIDVTSTTVMRWIKEFQAA